MTDVERDSPIREQLAVALRERGITSAKEFRRRYGIAPATLTAAAALMLVETPAWVHDIWIPGADPTLCAYIPQAVRTYAMVYRITQQDGESDHEFNTRLKAEINQRWTEAAA